MQLLLQLSDICNNTCIELKVAAKSFQILLIPTEKCPGDMRKLAVTQTPAEKLIRSEITILF